MTGNGLKIVLHDYSGHPFQVELARELARRGHTVHHCYSDSMQTPQGALQRRTDDPPAFSIAPISLGAPLAKYSYFRRWASERRYARLLRRRIAERAPDVVICGNGAPDIQAAALQAARAGRARYVFWLQDLYGEAASRILPQRLKLLGHVAAWWLSREEARCLRQSDAVVSISADFIQCLTALGVTPARISTIENWAPLDEITPQPKRNPWSERHDCADDFCFLYAGTLGLKHNPELLARLAEELATRPRGRLIVASQGLGADYLAREKAARGLHRLTLLPFQTYDSLPDMLGAADVAVALLELDAGVFSVPSKVLSYCAAGRAVLGAMPAENLAARLVVRENAGTVVAPDDVPGFVAAALALLDEPSRAPAMGRNARAYAERAFAIRPIADQFETIIAAPGN
ncbi:MAG: glycosyltransferase family 4 protein [Reyranellaceae bacterium]